MDDEEVEAVLAIYGDLAERCDGGVQVIVAGSGGGGGGREAVLRVVGGDGYPSQAAAQVEVEGRRGISHDLLGRVRGILLEEADKLVGLPAAFGLAERLKQLLDDEDPAAGQAAAAGGLREASVARETDGRVDKRSHQVGEPQIVDGTRCTEEVFRGWRERWLERRAATRAKKAEEQKREGDDRPTGKEIFEAMRDDDKAARGVLAQLLTDQSVDESLFS